MAKYLVSLGVRSGAGTALINGKPLDPEGYEEGTALDFNFDTDLNYSSINVSTRGNYIPASTSPSFSFTMPARDVTFYVKMTFTYAPSASYGLKYYYDFGNTDRECKRLEILQRSYTGPSEVRQLNNVIRRFGDRDADPVETFTYSSMDITFVANDTEYFEFVTGDARKYQVVLKYGDLVKFRGYIKPDYITSPEKTNITHEITLTAFDGLDDFKAIRFDPGRIRNSSAMAGFPPFSQAAIKAIATALNQSFQDGRPINISCELYESRMDTLKGMFEQWVYGENAIFNEGENPRFLSDETRLVTNEYLFLEDVLRRIINPFICNVFLWEDEFYIVRIEELTKPNIRFFKYQSDSAFLNTYTLANDQLDDCKLANGLRTGRAVYTQFTASLNMGVLLPEARGGEFHYGFGINEWVKKKLAGGSDLYYLKYWSYINAVAYSIQGQSPKTGSIAGVQYFVEGGKEYARIWTTTDSTGLSDPKLSAIERSVSNTGQEGRGSRAFNRGFAYIPFEAANVLVFKSGWVLRKRATSSMNKPPVGVFKVAFRIQVGSYFLKQNGNLFEWTNLEEAVVSFDVDTEVNVSNEINLVTAAIPESGELVIRLYQLIHTGGAQDLYFIDWEDAKFDIQENEALVLTEIRKRFNTAATYSKIYPKYDTFLGDAVTNQSTSAMRLLDGAVTEKWGTEQEPLLENIVQTLGNTFGRSNVSVYGNMVKKLWSPIKALQYKGRYWKINHIEINESRGEVSNVDLFDLGPLPATVEEITLTWENKETPPYIDCNLRIYVNEVLRVEVWDNQTGTLTIEKEDKIKVQFFYLANLIDPAVTTPAIQLLVDNVLVQEKAVTPSQSVTGNHELTANANLSLKSQSLDKASP